MGRAASSALSRGLAAPHRGPPERGGGGAHPETLENLGVRLYFLLSHRIFEL